MVTPRKYFKLRWIMSVLAEHFLLALALSFLVPPVPSRDETYSFTRVIIPMLLCLGTSRYLAMRRAEENMLGLVLKSLIFVVAGFVMFARVFGI